MRKLISARFPSLSSLAFDETWTAEERNDLTPSGPPNKFNRLKFIRLLQSAIRIGSGACDVTFSYKCNTSGHAYSSRAIAEALAMCTLEEMNEILSTEVEMSDVILPETRWFLGCATRVAAGMLAEGSAFAKRRMAQRLAKRWRYNCSH